MNFNNIPMAPAGIGMGMPTRWTYSEYGRFLNVYGIRNGFTITFNLASAEDIELKLNQLYRKRDEGLLDNTDLQELEERLRIMSNVNFYGNGSQNQTVAALQEGKSLSSKYECAIVVYDKDKMTRKNLRPWKIVSLQDDGERDNKGNPRVRGVFGNCVIEVKGSKNGAKGLYLATKSDVSKLNSLKSEEDIVGYIESKCKAVDVKKVDYSGIFDIDVNEEAKPTTSPKQVAHLRMIQPLAHTEEANEKRRKTLEEKRNNKILGLSEGVKEMKVIEAVVNEAMKVIKTRDYKTKYGNFRIETQSGKARRRDNYTGKTVWKEVTSSTGYFTDYKGAVEFFLYNDHGDKYISSSQGNNSYDWVDSLGVNKYDDALKLVDSEVVKCFRDYYGDNSIR